DGSVENNAAVGKNERLFDDVEFVVNFAHHLLEDVLERHKVQDAAEFIHDHGEPGAARTKFEQQFAGGLCFRNDQRVADQMPQMEIGGGRTPVGAMRPFQQQPDHILDVNKTEYVIERAFVDGQARTLGGGEHAHHFLNAGAFRKGVNIRARHHHLAHLHAAQLHRVLHEFGFGGGQKAAIARLLEHDLELFG